MKPITPALQLIFLVVGLFIVAIALEYNQKIGAMLLAALVLVMFLNAKREGYI